jgi:Ca-activated chloride channel family protein
MLAAVSLAALWPLPATGLTLTDRLHSYIQKGNAHYDKGEHDKALEAYMQARKQDSTSVAAQFNAGDAYYRLGQFQQGAKEFLGSASASADSVTSMSYYNLGNAAFKMNQYGAAAEAYKRALLIRPNDEDAKYNLEYALRMVEQQQQQQQNQDQEDQKKRNKDQQDQQQNQQDQQQEKQQEQNQQQQQDQQEAQQQRDQGDQQPQGQMTPEELKRILAAIEASDRETQQDLLKQAARTKRISDKDW